MQVYSARNGHLVFDAVAFPENTVIHGGWPEPAFREVYRLMKPHTLYISFYGCTAAEAFLAA
ncbi:hypothetical protein G6L16_023470 [Agrobacterium tumefaciens]|uniref:hypothetical protein n=1 Tax=Agrobacterium tumefaciens TaxID=358 RepID=UPI001573AEA1|nr:hypothetical protein [Agrobacterium tumefaciens]NSZ66989.1 hypothetical protein [Agrobacterium tumefaciens]NTA73340.1 hypothetical protein [Agrobacterium tumefaciens]WIE41152.1 hypothetical protein G6L16_023470 [Agrobacterium tumefaciens]